MKNPFLNFPIWFFHFEKQKSWLSTDHALLESYTFLQNEDLTSLSTTGHKIYKDLEEYLASDE